MNSTNGANFCLTDFSSCTIRNLVAKTAGGYNYAISTFQPSYTDAYGGSSGAYSRYSPTTGARTTNPLADGTTPSIKNLSGRDLEQHKRHCYGGELWIK
jgi:hypothetical protein